VNYKIVQLVRGQQSAKLLFFSNCQLNCECVLVWDTSPVYLYCMLNLNLTGYGDIAIVLAPLSLIFAFPLFLYVSILFGLYEQ